MKHAVCAAAVMILCLSGSALGGEKKAEPENLPSRILDESAANWFVDRFAGNSTAGPQFFQGPAAEIGGLGSKVYVAPAPDGTVYLASGGRIMEVTPKGTCFLLAGGGSDKGSCLGRNASIRAESLVYSASDKSIYFVHRTLPCIRRLFEKDGEWHVEVAAGSTAEAGLKDGAAAAARFKQPTSLAVTSTGTIYLLDEFKNLRKLEKGTVSTVAAFKGGKNITDGPLDGATMAVTKMSGMICLGDDDDTLYIADHWHFCARKIDLKNKTVKTVVGMRKPKQWRKEKHNAIEKRFNKNSDGPAFTHASFNSGCAFVMWDPVHKALWVDGPDAIRMRWLRNGELRTVFAYGRSRSKWPMDGMGVPGKDVGVAWAHVRAVDARGRAYIIIGSAKSGVWRAYEKGGSQ
jgi:hypothetical protein